MKAQQLKNAILQLAIQGKLVPQDPNDEPASVLLEKIKQEKEKLIAEGKIKKSKKASDTLPYLKDSEIPFEIPESWVWVRLGDIGIYKKGPFGSSLTKNLFIPKTQNAIKVYEQKNAIKKNVSLGEYYIPYDYFISHMQSFEVFAGDIIVSCAGTIGETFVMPLNLERGIINQALMRMNISKNIDVDYFLIYFDYILKGSSKLNSSGTAIKNIPPFSVFKKLSFALPPLSEQKRIVAKIETLLPFIEQYAKKEQELTALHQEFPEQLKKSILQAAIQGKLTEQNPNDEPAIELVKRIQAEKERLILEKKIKKPKQHSEIIVRDNSHYEIVDGVERCIDDEIPFEIPENWCWVRLSNVFEIHTGVTYGKSDQLINEGARIIRGGNIVNSQINLFDNDIWIKSEKVKPTQWIKIGDLLTPSVTSLENVGKFALIESNNGNY
ncbi:restriction endonuclease subunit S, partial [Haemophilus haemoglobinophilus]|nr:restriction endonuclease subunit S [Canicola haemoglobinophilus]